MRVVAKAQHERPKVFVHERVKRDFVDPFFMLFAGRKFAVDQEVCHLQKCGMLGELLNGVAAVFEDSFVAVDEGNGAATGSGVGESRVVDRDSRVVLTGADLAKITRVNGCLLYTSPSPRDRT